MTKENLLRLFTVIRKIQETSFRDSTQVHQLRVEANSLKTGNEPDVIAAIDAVIENAASSPSPVELNAGIPAPRPVLPIPVVVDNQVPLGGQIPPGASTVIGEIRKP